MYACKGKNADIYKHTPLKKEDMYLNQRIHTLTGTQAHIYKDISTRILDSLVL